MCRLPCGGFYHSPARAVSATRRRGQRGLPGVRVAQPHYRIGALIYNRGQMQTVWEYIRKERAALKRAPLSFAGLAVVCLAAGIGVGRWHYSERLETKDGQIQRYRVALRIDKAGGNALMELTNS